MFTRRITKRFFDVHTHFVTVASCTYRGSYALITDVYAAMIPWIEANGYETAGPMFNIYHVSPHDTKNPDEFVTEVCYPVKKK